MHWTLANADAVSNQAQALAVSRAKMYAAAANNVWKRPLIEILTSSEPFSSGVSSSFKLEQNYPNPFNPSTTIRYELPHSAFVTLKIYSTVGQLMATLTNGLQQAGVHQVRWNAAGLPSGVYFYRLESDKFIESKKIVLLR